MTGSVLHEEFEQWLDPSTKGDLGTVGGEAALLAYHTQAIVENALLSVAIYLAKHQNEGDTQAERRSSS
jgi:hypothetical protein